MSKQLLHAYQSHVVIAALNDRAFAIIKDESATSTSSVLELCVAKKDSSDGHDGTVKKADGGGDDAADESEEIKDDQQDGKNQKQKKKQKGKKHQSNQETSNPLEIQSVRCAEISGNIWLAVSREDKTLSLYSIPSKNDQTVNESEQQTTTSIYPTITYSLPKRARCLAFCSVPSASDGNDCNVIVAGDLSGDAIAFPVPTSATPSDAKSTTRRLLLGHTASIITGMNVVPTQHKKQFILTADRDEKVRVSCFPETHVTHGYLLGHSSFISTMDAALAVGASSSDEDSSQGRALCITGSGDGTVRLWDYQLCKEVGMVPVVLKKCSDDGEKEDDTKMPAAEENDEMIEGNGGKEQSDDEDNFDEDFTDDESVDEHAIAVPVSVALSANADNVVVARDGIASIDIHPIPPPPSKSTATSVSLLLSKFVSLHKKQTLECPSQPLAVICLADGSVLVLTKEPDYLLHYKCKSKETTDAVEYENESASSSFSTALHQAVKSQDIAMPTTTLERDEYGEWKLQKNKVNDSAAGGDTAKNGGEDGDDAEPSKKGLHWNDAGRKETAKLAEQRRRKRRKEDAKKEE